MEKQEKHFSDIHTNLHGQRGFQNVHIHTSKVLGTGAYGSVFQATLDNLPCAAKILHTVFFQSYDPATVNFVARFDRECDILKNLHHSRIVQFLGVVQDPYKRGPILLMELMKESLTEFLKHYKTTLSYHVQMNITRDIALALEYLHSKQVLHRDLSSNNVLLNDSYRAKVTDFFMSKLVDAAGTRKSRSKVSQFPDTPAYMPPEALRAKPRYSEKLDVFSLGVLIVQIITRAFPAPTLAERDIEDSAEIIVVPELERRKEDIDKISPNHILLPIVNHCLKDRDKDRPTAAEICQRLKQLSGDEDYPTGWAESQVAIPSAEENVTDIAQLQDQKTTPHREETQHTEVSAVRQLIAGYVNVI